MDVAMATVYDITKPNKQLTNITPTGVYTGTVQAENIIGSTISGKTIIGKYNGKDAIKLDGTSGVLNTYKNDGVSLAMQLSSGELTFYNASGLASLFVKNSNVSLSNLMNANSWSTSALGVVYHDGSTTSSSFSFTQTTQYGTYTASTSILLSADVLYKISTQNELSCSTSVNVSCYLYLDKSDGADGWISQGVVGQVNGMDTENGGTASVYVNKTMSISYTISSTGTYRYRMEVHGSSSLSGDPGPQQSFSASANMGSSMTTSLLQNGCFIATNGVTVYNPGMGRYFTADISNETVLRVKGKVDISGVLLSGAVDSGGNVVSTKIWGDKYATGNVSISRSAPSTVGRYRITHNLGHSRYVCNCTPRGWYNGNAAVGIVVITEDPYYCDIEIRRDTGYVDLPFNFVITGSNYSY